MADNDDDNWFWRWFNRYNDWILKQETVVGVCVLTLTMYGIAFAITGSFVGLIFLLRWLLPV